MGIRRELIAMLLGCAGRLIMAQDSPFAPPVAIDVRAGYSIEKVVLSERAIPVLLLSKDSFQSTKKPVVFLIHGGGMPDVLGDSNPWAKEGWFDPKYFDVPYTLADGGILVALMDCWWAGERFRPEHREIVKQNYLAGVIRGYIETTKDIPLLIDAMTGRDDADPNRIGVTGRSGGGIIALMAAAYEPRVTAVSSWVGGADMMAFAASKLPAPMVEFFIQRAPEIPELLEAFDPVHRFAEMPPAAVLMINNRNDPAVPFATAQALFNSLEPLYADLPGKLRLDVLDPAEPTHVLTEADYDEGCAWLIEHLKSAPSTN